MRGSLHKPDRVFFSREGGFVEGNIGYFKTRTGEYFMQGKMDDVSLLTRDL